MFSSSTLNINNYLFYDDCTSDNTSNYGSSLSFENNPSMTITYDTNNNCYKVINSTREFCLLTIPSLNGLTNIELSAEVNAKHTQDFSIGFQQTAHTGTTVSVNNNGRSYSHNYVNNVYTSSNENVYLGSNTWFKVVLRKTPINITYKIYNLSNTLLSTRVFNIADENNYFGIIHYPSSANSGYGLIRNIQAVSLS